MSSYMLRQIEELVSAIENAAETTNVSDMPNYKIRIMLRDEMLSLGMKSSVVTTLISNFTVSVSQVAWDEYNDHLVRMVKAMSLLILKTVKQIENDFPSVGDDATMIINMLNGAEIKLEI